MSKTSSRIQIIVAVIGLIGVLGAALIANWHKLVPEERDQLQAEKESLPLSAKDLIGDWEAQVPDNRFRIRIVWDEAEKAFHGFLAAQGKGSEDHGFRLGELIYIAEPMAASNRLREKSLLKWGRGGQSTREEWVEADFDIRSWPSSDEAVFFDGRRFLRVR